MVSWRGHWFASKLGASRMNQPHPIPWGHPRVPQALLLHHWLLEPSTWPGWAPQVRIPNGLPPVSPGAAGARPLAGSNASAPLVSAGCRCLGALTFRAPFAEHWGVQPVPPGTPQLLLGSPDGWILSFALWGTSELCGPSRPSPGAQGGSWTDFPSPPESPIAPLLPPHRGTHGPSRVQSRSTEVDLVLVLACI